MSQAGRNDPCPCGSGRKYKRCCLGAETQRREFERQLQEHGLALLRELGRFAVERIQATPEAVAAERFPFWRPPLDRARASRLLDYLIFDHRPNTYGRSAAQEYLAERGPLLSAPWRELLSAWQDQSMRLFVLERWSGGFAVCRPVLPEADAAIEVLPLEQGDIAIKDGAPIALRSLPVATRFVFASWPVTFGERSMEDVRDAIVARHHAFVRGERIASFEEFVRLRGTVFDEEAASTAVAQIIVPGRT
jgi:hypothetical protein